jgi:outer membrane protein
MRFVITALLVVGMSAPALAQVRDSSSVGPVMSLEEAVSLARRNNPTHLQSTTARERAGAAVRSAYGSLLPTVNTNFGSQYREGRQQFFAGQAFGSSSDVISSNAGVSLDAQFNAASLLGPRAQKAQLDAAELDVTTSEQALRNNVTQQYMTVLQAQARAQLQDTLLASTQAQLELAKAREAVGAATTLDVRRAEVAVGQQQVAVLQARNTIEIEKLRLFQQIGVPQPPNVQLTTQFPVTEPTLQLDDLLASSRRSNPALAALRAREKAADINVKRARSSYTPTLSLSTGINGYTSEDRNIDATIAGTRSDFAQSFAACNEQNTIRATAGLPAQSCSRFVFTDAQASAIRNANNTFPFSMTRNPITFSASLSLPIFDGFQREQRFEVASASRLDARYQERARELQVTADVTAAHLNLVTAYRTVRLQEQNSQAARQALELAQERFKVCANTFVDVQQARSDYERAETDRINAVYDFHKAYATLEAAVGHPLR